jgi:hypothetical protein
MSKDWLIVKQEVVNDKFVWVAEIPEWKLYVQSENKEDLVDKLIELAKNNILIMFLMSRSY